MAILFILSPFLSALIIVADVPTPDLMFTLVVAYTISSTSVYSTFWVVVSSVVCSSVTSSVSEGASVVFSVVVVISAEIS